METKRLTATEKEALLHMNVALEILIHEPEQLKNRVSLVPGAKRDLAMIATKIRKLMEGFRDTIPPAQIPIYERALRMSQFWVGARRPGDKEGSRDDAEFGMWISYEVLDVLLNGCHDSCLMCNLDKAARRACKLKKAIDIIPNDIPQRDDGDCPYYAGL